MPNDLYGPAASLLKGAGDTTTATMNREAEVDQAQGKLIQGNTNLRMDQQTAKNAQDQATERQKMAGDQQMQQHEAELAGRLKESEQLATQQKQKHDYEKFFTVSPELAQGLYKTSGGRLDFRDKVGSRQPTDLVMALASGYSRVESAAERGKGGGGKGLGGADKEFLKTYRGYMKDTENWNYETIKALADTDAKQAGDLKRKMDFIEQNKTRFNNVQGTKEAPEEGGGTGGGVPTRFKTADEVKAAYKAGKLKEDEAMQILRDNFGYGD